jgi:hypothetical protein
MSSFLVQDKAFCQIPVTKSQPTAPKYSHLARHWGSHKRRKPHEQGSTRLSAVSGYLSSREPFARARMFAEFRSLPPTCSRINFASRGIKLCLPSVSESISNRKMKMLVLISPIRCDVGDGMTDSGVWTVPLGWCFEMRFELQDGYETCPIEV